MKLLNKIFLAVPVLMLAISCTKKCETPDPINDQPEPDSTICSGWQTAAGLASISGPSTATVGQTIQLAIIATGRNGCATQASIIALPSGNNIALTGNVFYQGCICTQALVDLNSTYSFTPGQAGTYTFHGETYEGAAVVHTVTVQ